MEQDLTNGNFSTFLATTAGMFVFIIVAIWSSIWKAIALWKAARRNDTAWYVVLFILNTVGILEIIYIFAVAKEKKK